MCRVMGPSLSHCSRAGRGSAGNSWGLRIWELDIIVFMISIQGSPSTSLQSKKYLNVRVIAINQNIFCAVSIPAYPVPGCLANARMHKVSCPTFVVHGPTHRIRPGCQNASRRMSRMYTGVGMCWPMTRHVPLLLDPSRIPDATLGWSVCRIQFSALNSLEWISHDVTKSDAGCGCHLVNGYLHLSL